MASRLFLPLHCCRFAGLTHSTLHMQHATLHMQRATLNTPHATRSIHS
jgi:hypothetical protein